MKKRTVLTIALAVGALAPFPARPEAGYVPLIRLLARDEFWSASGTFYALFAGAWMVASGICFLLLWAGTRIWRKTG